MNQDARGKKCDPVGTLYEKDGPMFFREAQGSADGPDGPVYEFSTNVSGGHPILRHLGSGRTFTLGWRDIIELAEANGIAEPAQCRCRSYHERTGEHVEDCPLHIDKA